MHNSKDIWRLRPHMPHHARVLWVIALSHGTPMGVLSARLARLLDWCGGSGWEVEDTGGGCSALLKETGPGIFCRVTRANDPSMPQTFTDPILAGTYDADGRLTGKPAVFAGGIDEMLRSGE